VKNDAWHGDRSHGPVQPQDIMIEKMWDELSDEQKRTLIARMIDSKILMKENMIKYLKFKIETFNMVKDMICGCEESLIVLFLILVKFLRIIHF